jgi:hypothetical protein
MIEVKQAFFAALEDAKRKYTKVELFACFDIGDKYAFTFKSGGKTLYGAPVFTVEKNTGELGYLSIPPLENLKMLEKGTKIDISTIV